MAISAAFSSKHRRPKASAIRSFPPLRGLIESSAALPPTSGSLTNNRDLPPINLIKLPPEPVSRCPGNDVLSYRVNIKRPVVSAVRSYPKGCGPLATSISKIKRSKEASTVVVRGITEKGNGLHNVMDVAVVGRSLGDNDMQKPSRKTSQVPDIVEGNRRPEGSESKNEVEEMEEKLNDIVRRISEEASDFGKALENAVGGSPWGEKGCGKPIIKSSNGFSRPESLESKKELNHTMRKIPNERSGSGKNVENTVVGRSLDEKDGNKPNKKRPLKPDLVEGGRRQSGRVLDLRGDRLVVQALMTAKRCPWMQGKNKVSIGLQSRQKKPRVKENGNSAKE